MTATTANSNEPAHMAASAALSDARGPSEIPLLEETIGANLDRTVAAHAVLIGGPEWDALPDRVLVGELCKITEADRICIPVPITTPSAW